MPICSSPTSRSLPALLGAIGCASTLALSSGSALAQAAPTKVACVGEQTTHSDQLNRAVEYPAMLQKELGATYDVVNFGDCCATVLTGYSKQPETHPYLSGGSNPSFTQSLPFAPDIVIIGSWGKHDTEIADALYDGGLDPTQFQTDYETLLTTYLNLPNKPTVFLSTPVPIPSGQPIGPTTTVILPTVEAMAAKYNLPIVPLYAKFLNQPALYKDSTHVTDDAGLGTIAAAVYAAMTGGAAGGDAGAEATTPSEDDAGQRASGGGDLDAGAGAPTAPSAPSPGDDAGAASNLGDPEVPNPTANDGESSAKGAGCAVSSAVDRGAPMAPFGFACAVGTLGARLRRRSRGRAKGAR
jgi:hypothetical protein